jgi:RimJ/RimL family protein N-acetyltransferase
MNKYHDFFFLDGKNVGLRRISENDDLSNYIKWFNDQEVTKYSTHGKFPMTEKDIRSFISSINNTSLHLSIFLKETGEHIGNMSLQSIDMISRSAEFAVIMGESKYWGKGYSYEAADLLIRHGIQKLNLRRIYCGTAEENIGMKKLALKLGMSEEGRRKEAFFFMGTYMDIIEYGLVVNSNESR